MERASSLAGRLCAALILLALIGPMAGCGNPDAPEAEAAAPAPVDGPTGVRYRPVPGVPKIPAGPPNARGQRAMVACSTCHSMKAPIPTQRGGKGLASFHQGLEVTHGNLTCLSCHSQDDYDSLRLADGRRLPFERVRELCAQCHGPQARDYEHGAHGGMSGFWDTTRGEQVRNQCTHCHAPHAPAYPAMRPTFKPRDRFLVPHNRESNDD